MTAQDFETSIQNLSFLGGCEETIDGWTTEYERLLAKVKADEDQKRRKDQALAMQKILFKQFLFLQYEWRREKGLLPADESRKASQT